MKKDKEIELFILNIVYAYVEQVLLNIKIITPLKNVPKFLNGLNVLVNAFSMLEKHSSFILQSQIQHL